jgi:hypothetical protein
MVAVSRLLVREGNRMTAQTETDRGSSYVVAEATLDRKTADGFLVATAKLHKLAGNERPYFSVTGELWTSERTYLSQNDRYWREGGCIHERILAAFPKLAPVVALHLSDDTGAPTHDLANGWYWYEQGELDVCARHLRVSVADLPADADKEAFTAFVEAQRERWQKEANEAHDVIRRLWGL